AGRMTARESSNKKLSRSGICRLNGAAFLFYTEAPSGRTVPAVLLGKRAEIDKTRFGLTAALDRLPAVRPLYLSIRPAGGKSCGLRMNRPACAAQAAGAETA